jgi:hypothetical protein
VHLQCIANAKQKDASAMPIAAFARANESMSYSGDESNKGRPKSVSEALRNRTDVTRVFISQARGKLPLFAM